MYTMHEILKKINILYNNDDNDLYHFISEQLYYTSNDPNFWLSIAVVIIQPPFCDVELGIAFAHKVLTVDHNHPIALLILAHIYEYELGGIDDMLLHQIKNLNTNNNEINSMLKYVASWSYTDSKKKDPFMEEQLLKESIALCDKHVWNYEHLARLYIRQKRYLEINPLIKKALSNITKIYNGKNSGDATDINEFINERIKGIYLNDGCIEIVQEKLIPTHKVIFYSIITPFLNFYHFIKAKILKSMNIEEEDL